MDKMTKTAIDDRLWTLTSASFVRPITLTERADNPKVGLAPLLEAAVKWYGDRPPPFVMKKNGMRRGPAGCITEKTVELIEDKDHPGVCKQVNLFLRTWNDLHAFWTLDLNEERLIVKSFSGGPYGGSRFRVWIGIMEGFQDQPVALSIARQDARHSTRRNGPNGDASDEDNFLASQVTPRACGLSDETTRAKRRAKTSAGAKIKSAARRLFSHDADYVNGDTERKKTSEIYPSCQSLEPLSQGNLPATSSDDRNYTSQRVRTNISSSSRDFAQQPSSKVGSNDKMSSNPVSISAEGSGRVSGPTTSIVPDPTATTTSTKQISKGFSTQNSLKVSASKPKHEVISVQTHSQVTTSKRWFEIALLSDDDDVTPASKRRREVFSAPDPGKATASSKRRHEVVSAPRLHDLLSKRKDTVPIAAKPDPVTKTSGNPEIRLNAEPRKFTADTLRDQRAANFDRGIVGVSNRDSSSKIQELPAELSANFSAYSAPTPKVDAPAAPSQAATASEETIRKSERRYPRLRPHWKAKQSNQSAEEAASVKVSNMVTAEGLTPPEVATASKLNSSRAGPKISPPQAAPPKLDVLTPYKISNTSFLVTVPPKADFKVMPLSSCTNVSAISTSILKLFKLDGDIELVDSFRITFEWLPMDSKYRTMLVEPEKMASNFDFIFQRIDKAKVWVTGGECLLGVEILLKS
jgi:hypothetical protein